MDDATFFQFQERASRVLIGWGLGSVTLGLPALWSRNPLLRHAGIQSIAWGAIDAALGLFGRHSARKNIRRGATDATRQARGFRLIVLINTVLDLGYIAGGWGLVWRARGRGDRAGTGLGIMAQGLFLLIFDGVLTWLTGWLIDQLNTHTLVDDNHR
jgi:hypothetical protein